MLWRLMSGVAAGALLAAGAGAQETVGVAAAVNPQATGTPPQRAQRTLNVGLDMFRNEKVVTGPEGKTQLQFLDGSALTIGPNSEMVLDEFVYDPASGTGKLAMTATRGVFRLVGGKISKSDGVTLKTPTATLGIRGGIATATVGPGSGFFGFLFGQQMTVDGTGGDGQPTQQVVTRPGTGVPLGPNGVVLTPVPIPQDQINQQLGAFEGQSGQSGGARERPTENRVAATNLGNLGSSNLPASLVPPPVTAADPVNLLGAVADTADTTVASQVGAAPTQSTTDSVSTPVAPAPLFGSGFTGRYKSTPGSGSALGAGDGDPFFNRPVFGGPLGTDFVGLTIDPSFVDESSLDGLLFRAPLAGTVLETHPRGTFFSFSSAGTASPFGPISGKGFASANGDYVFYASDEVDIPGERSLLFAGVPTPSGAFDLMGSGTLTTYEVRPDAIFGSTLAFLLPQYGGTLPGTRSPAFVLGRMGVSGSQVAFLQGNLAINGQGSAQQSAVSVLLGRGVRGPLGGNGLIDGQARGTFRTSASGSAGFLTGPVGLSADALGNGVFGATSPDFVVLESSGGLNVTAGSFDDMATSLPVPVGISPNLGGMSSPTYFPNNLALRIDNPSGAGTGRQTATLNGFFNGFLDRFDPSGNLLDVNRGFEGSTVTDLSIGTNASNNTLAGVMLGTDVFAEASYTLPFGGMTGDGRSAYIDNGRLAAVESGSAVATRQGVNAGAFLFYVVGNDLVSTTNFLPSGVSYCACSASTFGFWGMDFVQSSGLRDRVHLGQFVAGVVPNVSEVPTTGTAMYTGHAVADVVRGTSRYKAAGTFSLSYTFSVSTPGGSWQVTNFDGGSLFATVNTSPANANIYSGSMTGSFGIDTISGGVGGAFFKSATDPVAETGSQFSASGTVGGQPYSVMGVAQGRR